MHYQSITQLSQGLKKGEYSSVELTQHYIDKIKTQRELNAFISLDEENALLQAKMADQLLRNGQNNLLTGIPMALKDVYCTTRMKTTCGSKMLANFHSPYNATIVDKLTQQGAILVGKTNMDEFAMGSANENSHFGPVKNPWDQQRVPGGSSGGSAAAVAADLVPYSIGSDTGGSIRQPAAFCGISGIKPTYGLVSRYGLVAYASSLDQAGPLARDAEDLSIVLEAIAGFDPKDSTSVNRPITKYAHQLKKPIDKMKIALPSCFFQSGLDDNIQRAIFTAVEVFKTMNVEFVEVDLKRQSLWVPCYYVIACAEASSNLSRYDGVRFGHRTKTETSNIMDLITQSRSEGFGVEVKRRVLTGTHVLSAGYFDAYYLQAQKIRRLIQDELIDILKGVDAILGPTTPSCAFRLGEKTTDPVQSYLADIYTVAANLAGLPALSIPAGFSDNLPIGLQLMGSHFSESTLLNLAYQYQQHTDWHLAQPQLR